MSNTFFQEEAQNLPLLVTRLVMNNRVPSYSCIYSEHIALLCCKQTEFCLCVIAPSSRSFQQLLPAVISW